VHVAAFAAAFVVLPAVAIAQTPPATPTHGVKPNPQPSSGHGSNGGHGHAGGNGRYTPGVIVNASEYLATPNPHKTPFHNTTHNDIPPGQDVFGSQSSDGK